MNDPGELTVALPEPVARTMRFGPFPSARAGLKFVAYAATGALVAAWLGALFWLPFVGIGFVASVYRPNGTSVETRLSNYVGFQRRRHRRGRCPSTKRSAPFRGFTVRFAPGRLVAIVETGGVPVAFLPPSDARALFEAYRRFLRTVEGPLYVVCGLEPVVVPPLLPTEGAPRDDEGVARAGYAELVRRLCRNRFHRRTRWAITGPVGRRSLGAARLERRLASLQDGIERLGIAVTRPRDAELLRAAAAFGWDAPRDDREP